MHTTLLINGFWKCQYIQPSFGVFCIKLSCGKLQALEEVKGYIGLGQGLVLGLEFSYSFRKNTNVS